MPFVDTDDGYLHDVFVSYAHADVEAAGDSHIKRWCQQFSEELRKEIAAELRRKQPSSRIVSMFVDESARPDASVDPSLPLSEQLVQAIRGSALLLVLMSPYYLNSPWCRKELGYWAGTQANKAGSPEGRIHVARILPTDHALWPDELRERLRTGGPEEDRAVLPGYWFFDRIRAATDQESARPFGYRRNLATEAPQELVDQLVDIAGRIARRLRTLSIELEDIRRQAAEKQLLAASAGQIVYLYGRDTYESLWQYTWSELKAGGYIVEPGGPEPINPEREDEIGRERVQRLKRCSALLLLGADPIHLDTDMGAIGYDARNLARSRWKKILPCSVIDKVGPVLKTPPRLSLAQEVYGIGWIDGTQPGWPGNLRSWLAQSRSSGGTIP
jgi:hypothetical protein